MQIESKENIIVKFCNSIWIERGLSNHTIESYKRDLLQYDLWLNEKSKKIIDASPTDGLWDDKRTDEDQLGASYAELEEAMEHGTGPAVEILKDFQLKNGHKMNPIPTFKL